LIGEGLDQIRQSGALPRLNEGFDGHPRQELQIANGTQFLLIDADAN
jgi:hypothetical protein